MWTIALSVISLLTCGYGLGRLCSRSRCQRLRTDLTAARHLAEHDPLTGLLNRVGAQAFYESQTAVGTSFTAVLVDLDRLKIVNDTWGHQAGDAQLVAVAGRLAEACEAFGGVASRLAGDEFLLLLPTTEPTLAQAQATAALTQLSAPITLVAADGLLIDVAPSASAGIAVPRGDQAWASLLRQADIAMYQAKNGRGRAVVYTAGMQQPIRQDSRGTRLRDLVLVNCA